MGLKVVGKNKADVEEQINQFLAGFEKNGSYDYVLDVRKREGYWQGNLIVIFHVK